MPPVSSTLQASRPTWYDIRSWASGPYVSHIVALTIFAERHLNRHRQKDAEAGAEGSGVLNTRKRSWKASDGSVVTKRPSPGPARHLSPQDQPQQVGLSQQCSHPTQEISPVQADTIYAEVPISPPTSTDHSDFSNHEIDEQPHDAVSGSFEGSFGQIQGLQSLEDQYMPQGQDTFWIASNSVPNSGPSAAPQSSEFLYDEVFQPDTASSFNMPYTTAVNYKWLFNMNDILDPNLNSPPMSFPDLNYPAASQGQQIASHSSQYPQSPGSVTAVSSGNVSIVHDYQMSSNASPVNDKHSSMMSIPIQSHVTQPPIQVASLDVSQFSARNKAQEMTSNIDTERPMSMLQSPSNLPVLDDETREQLLELIESSQPATPDGNFDAWDHPLLSLTALQDYCDLYFTRFNTAYPLIHHATFDPSQTQTLLLLSVLLLGATYSSKDAHQLAVCIHDVIRPRIFAHAGFSAKPDLWVLQTILLVECFGKSRAGQKQHDMSHLFHGLLINLIRRSDCQSVKTVRPYDIDDNPSNLDSHWRRWAEAEEKKRLALLCFMWDTQHAVLFCQSLCMSAFELRLTMPCSQALWEAPDASEWKRIGQTQQHQREPLFLTALKSYLTPTGPRTTPLNALSRILLLHGLMSISWDMERRDQTSLGVVNFVGGSNWRNRLCDAYDLWKADFDTYCMEVAVKQRAELNNAIGTGLEAQDAAHREFTTFATAYNAVYHAAHVLLNAEFLDIQIYAGARHILGRPVQRADYLRSERVVKRWAVVDNSESPGFMDDTGGPKAAGSARGNMAAAKAAWHAACLLHDASTNLDDFDAMGLFHVPWCLYLATLTSWAFHHARPGRWNRDSEDGGSEMVWDARKEMDDLISSMAGTKPWNSVLMQGRRRTGGLVWIMANALSKVRWGIVHSGVMVLRGLVPGRLINQYETS